jgi:hypothetical protein
VRTGETLRIATVAPTIAAREINEQLSGATLLV